MKFSLFTNSSTESFISKFLDNPYLFNYIRRLLAGDQSNTKEFVYKNLLKYKCKSVLDLGCGTGDFAEACPKDVKYLGTDLNERFINYAKKRYKKEKNKKFVVEDLLKEKEYQKYDAVLLISMMHHFSDKDFSSVLTDVKKISKKIVIVADIIPNPPHPLQKFFVILDQGKFVRPKEEKLKVVRKFFRVGETKTINSRIAVQFGIVCLV